jgi:uncharacterized protein with NRDE domain
MNRFSVNKSNFGNYHKSESLVNGDAMCLILFAYRIRPDYPLVLAANRDEFYARPTAPLGFWQDQKKILAGRDLKARGTWMGAAADGRWAAITNYRDPAAHKADAPSRGRLVVDFLAGDTPPLAYLENLRLQSRRFNGFNLLVGDRADLFFFSNRNGRIQRLHPGLYGLSNHLLDTPWPKVARGKQRLGRLLAAAGPIASEAVFDLLGDRTPAPDRSLPKTGVGPEWERRLSPLFITSRDYGTRSSSLLLMNRAGALRITERTFGSDPPGAWEPPDRTFRLPTAGP